MEVVTELYSCPRKASSSQVPHEMQQLPNKGEALFIF
jgi:hypothetical protein